MSNILSDDKNKNIIKDMLLFDEFFKNEGYLFLECKVEKSKLLNDAYVFLLQNKNAKRQIEFTMRSSKDKKDFNLSVYFFNEKKQSLDVEAYLKSKDFYQEVNKFKLSSYAGSFQERFAAFLDFVHEAIKQHMYSIIKGKAWKTILFDWHGYK